MLTNVCSRFESLFARNLNVLENTIKKGLNIYFSDRLSSKCHNKASMHDRNSRNWRPAERFYFRAQTSTANPARESRIANREYKCNYQFD